MIPLLTIPVPAIPVTEVPKPVLPVLFPGGEA